jgi:hypothetical protein
LLCHRINGRKNLGLAALPESAESVRDLRCRLRADALDRGERIAVAVQTALVRERLKLPDRLQLGTLELFEDGRLDAFQGLGEKKRGRSAASPFSL